MATSIDRVNVFIFNPQIAIIFNLVIFDSNTRDEVLPQDFAVWLSGKASDDHGDANSVPSIMWALNCSGPL